MLVLKWPICHATLALPSLNVLMGTLNPTHSLEIWENAQRIGLNGEGRPGWQLAKPGLPGKSGSWNGACVCSCIATRTRKTTSRRWTWTSWVCLRRSVRWQTTSKYSWTIHPSPVCAFSATFDASTDAALQGSYSPPISIVACRHARACRMRYCFINPVCLPVCLMPVLYENERIYCRTFLAFW